MLEFKLKWNHPMNKDAVYKCTVWLQKGNDNFNSREVTDYESGYSSICMH